MIIKNSIDGLYKVGSGKKREKFLSKAPSVNVSFERLPSKVDEKAGTKVIELKPKKRSAKKSKKLKNSIDGFVYQKVVSVRASKCGIQHEEKSFLELGSFLGICQRRLRQAEDRGTMCSGWVITADRENRKTGV